MQLKKANVKKVVDICRRLFVVGEDGFEPSKRNAADLQSVPFGHSGTPPYSFAARLEPVDGLVQSRSGSVKPSPATLIRVALEFSSQ